MINTVYLITAVLFSIGLYGAISRKNFLIILMSLEIMFNASLLLLLTASSIYNNPDGISFFFIIIAVAACEVALGLSIAIAIFRKERHLDISKIKQMTN
ncbi:MAG: NADH-quinone oxidoreductase subunit NuoK [Planctomycetes bacterium]|nr:NADH-quinone oxidoreductase subunit NuoK [Planctomycetota bacterium]